MLKMDTDISAFLNELENSLKCPICGEMCKAPIRIKSCGHYFCQVCLANKNSRRKCPKCGLMYSAADIDKDNIARQYISHFQFRTLLETSLENNISVKPPSLNETKKVDGYMFVNNNKTYFVNFMSAPTKKNRKGETQLHLACKKCKVDEVKRLLGQKVDINAKDYAGWAPLHEAIQSGSLEIVDLLLQNGCLVDIPGPDHITPLHKATCLNNLNVVKLLLRYGADPNVVDYNGLNPFSTTSNLQIKDILETYTLRPINNVFNLYISTDICVYCHSIDDEYKSMLAQNKSIKVLNKICSNEKLTHIVIKKTHKISFKILQGILVGVQFLEQTSIKDFVCGNYFIDIPNYIFLSSHEQLNIGIRKSMISSLLKLPKLFDGLRFYIQDHNIAIDIYNLKVDKEYLVRLIQAGGGQILQRAPALRTCETENIHPYYASFNSQTCWCCNYILYPENKAPQLLYNMRELKHKASRWLIDCIVKFEICD